MALDPKAPTAAVPTVTDAELAVDLRPRPVFLRQSVVDRDGPGGIGPHRHVNYEAILVHTGPYHCRVNNTLLELPPGHGVLVKPGDQHEDIFPEPRRVRYMALRFRLQPIAGDADSDIFQPRVSPRQQCFALDLDAVWPLIDTVEREAGTPDRVATHVQDSLLSALFWWLIRALPVAALNRDFLDASGQNVLAVQLARLFRNNLETDLSVPDMARQMQMSESSLAHRCKAEMGVSPRQAYIACKMERATYLLANSRLSVNAIAQALGYDDPTSFSRVFRAQFGVPPGRWRRDNC